MQWGRLAPPPQGPPRRLLRLQAALLFILTPGCWAAQPLPTSRAAVVAQVYQRVQKHLGSTSPYLVDQVWDK